MDDMEEYEDLDPAIEEVLMASTTEAALEAYASYFHSPEHR